MSKNNLLANFKHYIESNNMLRPEDKVLLTVSGGVDSMVMLDIFAQSDYTIGVAHCNFQLRGEESYEDEVLVEQLATKHGVAFYNKRFETTAEMDRTGESMEMAARRLRYEWFAELSAEHGYTAIAVAHHSDDSIETFFINLLRGTGLRGLTGIKKHIGRIIRPLMFSSRKEITEYAVAAHIAFREDSSNKSTKYLRNKIRLGIVPRIREINSKFTELMRENIARLTDAQLFINSCIESIKAQILSQRAGIHTLHISRIDSSLPRNFVVYEILSANFGFKGDVVDSLMRAYDDGATGKEFYAKEYVAYIDRGEILITAITIDDLCQSTIDESIQRAYCGNSVLYFERLDIGLIEQLRLPSHVALLDADKLEFPLTVRRWREGDSFIPFGMEGRKKVSDYLVDEKVSRPEKERQFLLLSGEEIVWVIGRRIDGRFAIDSQSENVLRITKEII